MTHRESFGHKDSTISSEMIPAEIKWIHRIIISYKERKGDIDI